MGAPTSPPVSEVVKSRLKFVFTRLSPLKPLVYIFTIFKKVIPLIHCSL